MVRAWWAAQNGADATMNALGDAGRGAVGNLSKVVASPVYAGNAIANLFRASDQQNSFSMDDLSAPSVDTQGIHDALFQERQLPISWQGGLDLNGGGGTAAGIQGAVNPNVNLEMVRKMAGMENDQPLAPMTETGRRTADRAAGRQLGKPDVIKRTEARNARVPDAVKKKRQNAAALDWGNRGTLQQDRIDQQVRRLAMNEIAAAGHTPYNDTMLQRRMQALAAGFGY